MRLNIVRDGGHKFRDVSERASANTFLRNFTEPALHHVEPGTGRGSKVQVKTRMPLHPGFDAGVLVGPVVVDNQMQVQMGRGVGIDPLEEPDKLLMPVPRHTISDDLAIEHAQGRKERGRAIALVVVGLPSWDAGPQRQQGLRPVEGLDLALLVDAQDQSFVGRIQIQADHIAQLLHELLVPAEFERLDQMRFEVVMLPDALNGHSTDPLGLSHAARTPMGRVRRGAVQGCFDHRANLVGRDSWQTTRTRGVFLQTGQPKSQESLSPQLHRGPRDLHRSGNLLVQHPLGGHPDNLRPLNQTQGKDLPTRPGVQGGTFLARQENGFRDSAHGYPA